MFQIANGLASIHLSDGNIAQILINKVPDTLTVLHIPHEVDGVPIRGIGTGENGIIQVSEQIKKGIQ